MSSSQSSIQKIVIKDIKMMEQSKILIVMIVTIESNICKK